MTEDSKTQEQTAVEAAVIYALERKPEIAIPADFAARIARSVPAKSALRTQVRPVFGQTAGYLAAAAIMGILALMARAHPEALEAGQGILFALELLLVLQLLAVGLWLGMRNDGA